MFNDIRRGARRLRARVNRFLYDRRMLDQYVVTQALPRTICEYDIKWYGEAEIYNPPKIENNLKFLGMHNVPMSIMRPYYLSIQNALVSNMNIIDPENPDRVFIETFPELQLAKEGRNWYMDFRSRRKIAKASNKIAVTFDSAFLLSAHHWDNYYHFVVDTLLRFVGLDEAGALDGDTTLLLSSRPNRWQSEYLDLLEVGRRPIAHIPELPRPLKVGQLVVAAPRRHRFICSQQAVESLKARIFSRLGLVNERRRRIYVTRRLAGRRRIVNESEVVACVRRHGFEVRALEQMTVREQIQLFAEAETVVAPHGAGLVNLIYADRPHVIELLAEDHWSFGYFVTLTNTVGGRHTPIVAEGARSDARHFGFPSQDDFTVDVAALETALRDAPRERAAPADAMATAV